MFKVDCLGPKSEVGRIVAQGYSIGYRGEPLVFSVTIPQIEIPLNIYLELVKEEGKGSATVEVGDIVDNSVSVRFYNGIENGRSGIGEAISIVGVEDYELKMLFHIESFLKAPTFSAFYTFFEVQVGERVFP